jgi:hypothetical protein
MQNGYFDGQLTDVRVYGRAISGEDVANLAASTPVNLCTGQGGRRRLQSTTNRPTVTPTRAPTRSNVRAYEITDPYTFNSLPVGYNNFSSFVIDVTDTSPVRPRYLCLTWPAWPMSEQLRLSCIHHTLGLPHTS